MKSDERRWTLLRTFYRSYTTFHGLLERYESQVTGYVAKYGVDRKELTLPPDELLSLFDSRALVELRDGDLETLRQTSKQLFRGARRDAFDNHVSNIYHEVSLLKEEEWTLRDVVSSGDPDEYQRYYREVNKYYPKRLKHVRNVYGKARKRLEKLLPTFAGDLIVQRSIHLFGDDLLRGVYRRGVDEFLGCMYPEGGAVTGHTVVADSFREAGFGEEAAKAYGHALAALKSLHDEAVEKSGARSAEAKEKEAARKSLEKRRDEALLLA